MASTPATPQQTTAPATAATTAQEILPSPTALLQAARLAMKEDRPIQLDYYEATHKGTAFIGEDPVRKQKMLVKSSEEFTSLVQHMYKAGTDILVVTENSIYLVSGMTTKRRIDMSQLLTE